MENNLLTFNEENHEYLLNGSKLPSVTTVLQDTGIVDLSGIPYLRLEAAREFGLAVHSACKLYDLDDLDEKTLDHNLRPYLDAWIMFKLETGIRLTKIEQPIHSNKYRFAGTPDRVGDYRGMTIVEIKSTAVLAPATAIQTAGYMLAENETAYPQIKKRIAVLLQPDGRYKIESYKLGTDTNVFLSALSVYNWRQRNKK